MLSAFDQGKATRDGMEIAVQCILMKIGKSKDEKDRMRQRRGHYHEYIEVLYALEADISVWLDGVVYRMRDGDMMVINSKEVHDVYGNGEQSSYIVIKFLPQILYATEQNIAELKYMLPFVIRENPHQRWFPKEEIANTPIPASIKNVYTEWTQKNYGYELVMRSEILRVFAWILRCRKAKGEEEKEIEVSDALAHSIQKALEYAQNDFENANAREAARRCSLSYSYFSRSFKRIIHMSFTEYVNLIRLNEAKRLLLSTDMSVTEIAAQVGFCTDSYFIEHFKRANEMSPKQFRRRFLAQRQN